MQALLSHTWYSLMNESGVPLSNRGRRIHQLIGSYPVPRRGPQPWFSSSSRNLKPKDPCLQKELAKFEERKLVLAYTNRWNNKQKKEPQRVAHPAVDCGAPVQGGGSDRTSCWQPPCAQKGPQHSNSFHTSDLR